MGPAHGSVPAGSPSPLGRDRLTALLGITDEGEGRVAADVPDAWANPWGVAYGGYVAALLARAVERACPPGQRPVQLHVTFLRGLASGPVVAEGTAARPGRTATELAATLVQGRRVVARAAARGVAPGEGPAWSLPAPAAPPPEACPPKRDVPGMGVRPAFLGTRIELRHVPSVPVAGGHGYREWIRLPDLADAEGSLPFAAMALLADLGGGSAFGLAGSDQGGPRSLASLDLALHVVRAPAPGWLLAEVAPTAAAGGLVTSGATYWDDEGACAQVTQVALLGPRNPRRPDVDSGRAEGHPRYQTDRSVGRPAGAEEGAHP